MKPAQGSLWNDEPTFLRPELVRAAAKEDNRDLIAAMLRFWPLVQNRVDKVPTTELEIPTNDALALLAEGYAAAFRGAPA